MPDIVSGKKPHLHPVVRTGAFVFKREGMTGIDVFTGVGVTAYGKAKVLQPAELLLRNIDKPEWREGTA